MSPLFDLSGKVAFVPGGYGGIGAAIAWGLARHGAEVIVAGRDAGKAEALAGKMREQGLRRRGNRDGRALGRPPSGRRSTPSQGDAAASTS